MNKKNKKNKNKINNLALATVSIIAMSNSTAYANTSLCNAISNSPYKEYNLSWLNCDTNNNNNYTYNNNLNNNTNNNTNTNTNNNNNTNTNNNNNNTNTNNNNNNTNTNNNTTASSIEQEVVRLVNIERAKYNLQPLILDNEVSGVARLKSQDMNNRKYFSHTSPTYGTPFDMLKAYNITYKSAGENIAKGQRNAQAVVTAWMNSEGHRRNILSNTFTHIGVGFDNYYWTQLFVSK